MPYNSKLLRSHLTQMKKIFLKDPIAAVRGQGFIKILHDYCMLELTSRGFNKKPLVPVGEAKILTSHKLKDTDVAIIHPTSGPLLIIGVRSQMSSLSKNFLNYFEMEVGEVSAIHERYPLCVVGLLYLHPLSSILTGKEKENFDFVKAEKMFNLITGREKGYDPQGLYEEIAYMRIDFKKNPPHLDESFPANKDLRLDNFFDKLLDKYIKRNFHLHK